MNQKESLVNEVKCLRGELQQVRDDRDRQTGQIQALTAEVLKYKESTGKSFAEIDNLMAKTKSLEVCSDHFLNSIHIDCATFETRYFVAGDMFYSKRAYAFIGASVNCC